MSSVNNRMQKHFPHYTKTLIPNARKLRREMTDAERKLWSLVRANQLGVKIRRQVPIGRYIVDFLCEEKKLIIELDGGQHYEPQVAIRDQARDNHLRNEGCTILRIENFDVLKFTDFVLMEVESYLQQDMKTSAPQEKS